MPLKRFTPYGFISQLERLLVEINSPLRAIFLLLLLLMIFEIEWKGENDHCVDIRNQE